MKEAGRMGEKEMEESREGQEEQFLVVVKDL